jgi:PAS domain S-box-containing protein
MTQPTPAPRFLSPSLDRPALSSMSDSEQVSLLKAQNIALEEELKQYKIEIQKMNTRIESTVSSQAGSDRHSATLDYYDRTPTHIALTESEARFRSIFDQAAVGLSYVNLEGQLKLFNQHFCQMLGYSPEELLTKTFMEITHPEDLIDDLDSTSLLFSGELPHFVTEKRYLRQDGSFLWVQITVSILYGSDGNPEFIMAASQDISQRKQAESALQQLNQELEDRVKERTRLLEWSNEKLRDQEQFFRRVFENAPIAMAIVNLENLYFNKVNPMTCEVLGYSAQELTDFDTSLQNLLHPEEVTTFGDTLQQMINQEIDVYRQERRCVKKTGEVIWLKITIALLSLSPNSPQNAPAQGLCMAEDITEARQAEIALRDSEMRFRRLFDSNVVGMFFLKISGEITAANDLFLNMLGYTRHELETGQIRWDQLTPPEHAIVDQQVIAEAQRTGIGMPWEKEYFHKDGSRVPVLVGGGMIEGSKDEGIAFSINISKQRAAQLERDRAEEELKASLLDKEVLLKEIHHRVKNNMQMISSLLNLQAGSIQDPRILQPFKDSQNRVKAMALIHEKLYQSTSLAKVNLAEYVQSLAADLMRSYSMAASKIKLCCNITEVEMEIDAVIPCGLIINELVSNSIKYAFPDRLFLNHVIDQNSDAQSVSSESEIQICFLLNEAHQYVLTVADNGIGMPKSLDFRNTISLGLQLVCALAAKLGGTVEMDSENGTLFRIIFQRLDSQDN